MAKASKAKSALANPGKLSAFDKGSRYVTVIIETPKGSRNKYAFDPEERIFGLKKVLPAGIAFPYDFGFVPSTIGGDGDPLDVLVLMDEPAFAGCKLTARVIGIIEGEQGEKKEWERNDRVVAIEVDNHSFSEIRHIKDLGKQFQQEIEEFFVTYHRLDRKQFRVLNVKGPGAALKAISQAQRKGK